MDSEIYMDICLNHYPLRDWKGMWSEMNNIVKDYAKLGHRNKNAIARGKLSKHMCHLVRLYAMCIDMLNTGEIITFREKEKGNFKISMRSSGDIDVSALCKHFGGGGDKGYCPPSSGTDGGGSGSAYGSNGSANGGDGENGRGGGGGGSGWGSIGIHGKGGDGGSGIVIISYQILTGFSVHLL